MEFPKMLYKATAPIESEHALKEALHSGVVQTVIVKSAREQNAAKGFTEDLGSLITEPEAKSAGNA
ncbi:hypothetical protein [Paraburkholderia silvatlantica]|uniref:Uncharacterized protein n=1 Tax=Paraburkholderia silvatlantica TaxID=321895 RepID=A0ABR6FLU2_9BURK|nr:hypothetical protein [Paraburkholderia silvatlantica]MBB2928390.1 hypothetical protein [Paraburkholderia silvatlantica]PVY34565.1 hypothetical protein C7411_107101 [Paraburkholderia silvatlantica]PXW38780.1 hypothetical protein C7413_107101 [Paraburkholderia silvatlantica]